MRVSETVRSIATVLVAACLALIACSPSPAASSDAAPASPLSAAHETPDASTGEEAQAGAGRIHRLGSAAECEIPARFDTRDATALTPVKAQSGTGGCWAFASIAALESYLRVHEVTAFDLSENHLMTQLSRTYDESFERDRGGGGDDLMAVGYYVSWRGPVQEESDPFPASTREDDMVQRTGLRPVRYVQEVLLLPERKDPLDNENIKRAVMEHGAVVVAMWKGSPQTFGPYYNEETFAWYYDLPYMNEEGGGHEVTIVGWDDTFSKSNFKITPPGDGAFIVRNTKGPLWGHPDGKKNLGGYFYASYYDRMLMTRLDPLIGNHVFSRVDKASLYDRICQHDLLGYNYPLELPSQNVSVSFANVFQTVNPHGEMLKAVSFYALAERTEYEVFVVPRFSGTESFAGGIPVASGSLSLPGYYTVDLEQPLRLEPDTRFSVAVRLTAETRPVIATDSINGKSVKRSVSKAGESYVLLNDVWTDLYSLCPDTNVCLKAFTCDGPVPDSELMSVADMKTELDYLVDRILTYHPVASRSGFSPEQSEAIESARRMFAAPLPRQDYYFAMQRVFAAMGDGHTVLHDPFQETLYLDLPFEWLMDDGIVVSRDTGTLMKGDQVLKIGGASPEELVRKLAIVVSHENEFWVRHNAPFYLSRASYLLHLDLVNPDRTVDVEVLRGGKTVVYRMPITKARTTAPVLSVDMEWHLEKANNLGYFRFDSFPRKEDMEPLAREIGDFFRAVSREGVTNIAFDWRFNEGGFAPILDVIFSYIETGPVYSEGYRPYGVEKKPEDLLFRGTVYVLTSNRTYSAAVLASVVFRDNEVALTVGEPTGENPAFNRDGSVGGGDLPVTGWHFMLTASSGGRPRNLDASEPALFPDIPVPTSRLDLVAGRDIQLERLREITAGRGWTYPVIAVNVLEGTDSLALEQGGDDSFDFARNAVILADPVSSVERVTFRQTASPNQVHEAMLEGAKVTLPETLKPGTTYHMVFETGSRTTAFLTTVVGPGTMDALPSYIRSFTYSSRFNYFLVTFIDPIKSLRRDGISVIDSKGEPRALRWVGVGEGDDCVLVIAPREPVTKNDRCMVAVPANAFVLSSGVTNAAPLVLREYRYY